jgi:hypothetical protein
MFVSHPLPATRARQVITTTKLRAGTTGPVVVELPPIPHRPGEYPVFGRISDLGRVTPN